MRGAALGVIVCLGLAVPGCQKKGTTQDVPGTQGDGPAAKAAAEAAQARRTSMIEWVSVALRMGPERKDPGEALTVRILRGSNVLAQSTIGAGETWGAGSVRALELSIPPVSVAESRDLILDIAVTAPTGELRTGGPVWSIRTEALGQLTDGRVVRLLDQTANFSFGGENPARRSWMLGPR